MGIPVILLKAGALKSCQIGYICTKMKISGKDFQEIFQNHTAFTQLIYESKMALFAKNNNIFDAQIFKTILAGFNFLCMYLLHTDDCLKQSQWYYFPHQPN